MLGSGSAITTSTVSLKNPSISILLTSSTASLTSIAILITIEDILKLKIRWTKIKYWIFVIILLYEKALKTLMVDLKNDEKEAQELKKTYNHCLDRRTEIMKNTSFEDEDVFGNVVIKDSISLEQITEINGFSAKLL